MDLIERLEAGERWSGDNAEVLALFGYEVFWAGGEVVAVWRDGKLLGRRVHVPLDSVDDALRLVPEGWQTVHVDQSDCKQGWRWVICPTGNPNAAIEVEADSPCLALTIAALAASHPSRGQGDGETR